MARDLRIIGNSKVKYPDLCYLYDKQYVANNKLVEGATPLCRFYKRDKVAFEWRRIEFANGSLSNDNHFVGTIETTDHVEMARVGMFVKDQTGMLFIIESGLVSDDANKSKSVGTRPTIKTTMILRGVEK